MNNNANKYCKTTNGTGNLSLFTSQDNPNLRLCSVYYLWRPFETDFATLLPILQHLPIAFIHLTSADYKLYNASTKDDQLASEGLLVYPLPYMVNNTTSILFDIHPP